MKVDVIMCGDPMRSGEMCVEIAHLVGVSIRKEEGPLALLAARRPLALVTAAVSMVEGALRVVGRAGGKESQRSVGRGGKRERLRREGAGSCRDWEKAVEGWRRREKAAEGGRGEAMQWWQLVRTRTAASRART